MTIMLLLFGAVLALVLINVPIAVSLGIVALVAMVASHGLAHPAEPRARHLQRRDQLPAARDPAVHPRRRDHERVGHLAAADRVRVGAVRLDPRRPRARVDRRVDVLRRDLRLGGRRRRGAGLDPDPGDEGEGLSGAVRRRGDVVGGDARGHHPAVDPDDPLRGDGRDVGRAALRRRHRAGRARRLRADGHGVLVRAPLQPAARGRVLVGARRRAPRARRCGRSCCRSSSSAASSAASSPRPRARRSRWSPRCSSASSSTASSTSRTCGRR